MLTCGIALASCSSHGSGIVPSAGNSQPGYAAANAPGPPVISAAFIRNAGRIDAPNVPLRTLPRFLKSAHGIAPLSTVLPGDLEQVGVAINPGGPYAGVYAAQTAYTNNLLQIGFPPGATGTSSLFAPLIVPSNKSCLGTGEVYSNTGTGTSASFFVVDVCAGAIPFATPMNAAFAQNYTRISLRGIPELLSLVFSTDAVPTASSVWYAMIYNYAAGHWDIITQKTGISGNGTGVSTWLSEFVVGQCPSTPPIASDSMFLYNATSGNFEVMAKTMAHTTTSVFTTNPTCYLPDISGPASFVFAVSVPNSSWGALATPPTPVITEFGIPTANSLPRGITTGPDGALWFTEGGFNSTTSNKIGRVTTSGAFTEYTVPTASSHPEGITTGPDGALWFTESGSTAKGIGRVTTSGAFTEYTIPTASSGPIVITTGPDGALWFTESNSTTSNNIGRVTTSGAFTEYTIPTASSEPIGITTGPDGALWFTEEQANKIGRITPGGTITEFGVTTANSGPYGITTGPDGALWFTEFYASKIGRITPSGTITEFAVPTTNSIPVGITAGPDGNLWFTEYNADKIGRITTSGMITEFTGPTGGPYGIAAGPDGNLWFTEQDGNTIGRITP
jgi:virginiamycin B lyase